MFQTQFKMYIQVRDIDGCEGLTVHYQTLRLRANIVLVQL